MNRATALKEPSDEFILQFGYGVPGIARAPIALEGRLRAKPVGQLHRDHFAPEW
jgi:hypothetical protein